MKYLIIILLLGSISCSSSAKIKYEYNQMLISWYGSHLDDLTLKWGYPQGNFKAPNGNTVWFYEGANCRVTFEVDSNANILQAHAMGTCEMED